MKAVKTLIPLLSFLLLTACTSKSLAPVPQIPSPVPTVLPTQSTTQENKICDWVDKSDVIIKLNFAPGVTKDTSYEAGFALSPTKRTARLARQACDYRTGFSFSELKNIGAVQIAVWGYSDNHRRQLADEPISLVLGENGHPSIGSAIEVTVKD